MTPLENQLLARGAIIQENQADSDRVVSLCAPTGGTVFLSTWGGGQGLSTLTLDRAALLAALTAELGLVHSLEVEATSADWDAELAALVVS